MNTRRWHFPFTALVLMAATGVITALSTLSAQAQVMGAPPAVSAPATPAPPGGLPGPRLLTPEEKRDIVAPADDARPEGTVTPQITIPLGQGPLTVPPPRTPAMSPGKAAPMSGGVNDASARCKAYTDRRERANCRNRIPPDAPTR